MNDDTAQDAPDDDTEAGLDPVLAGILGELWQAATDPAARPMSLARLSKRAGVQMSVLRRVLTQLEDAGLAMAQIGEDGRGTAQLTDEGRALCDQLFGGAEGDDDSGPEPSEHLPRIH